MEGDPIIFPYEEDSGAYCKYQLRPPLPEKIYQARWFLLFQFGKDFHWKQENEMPIVFTNISPFNDWDLYKEKHVRDEFNDFVRECDFKREEGRPYYIYYMEVNYERLHDIEDLFDRNKALDKVEIEEVLDWITNMKPIRVN